VGQDAAHRERGQVEPARGIERGRAVAVGDHELVIVRQQVGRVQRHLRLRRVGRAPVGAAVNAFLHEFRSGLGQPSPDIAHGQARPPGAVLDLRRAVAGEVAPHQLGHGLLARPARRSRSAGIKQGIGLLAALAGAAGDQPVQLGVHEQAADQQTGDPDPGSGQRS